MNTIVNNNLLIKLKCLNSNTLKMIAICVMLFDHIVYLIAYLNPSLYPTFLFTTILHIPGKIVAPIMCNFIAQGYYYTRSRKKYVLRLFIFALISHIPYNLFFGTDMLMTTSIIWGLMLGLISLIIVKKENLNKFLKVILVLICCFFALFSTYDTLPVLWILVFGVYKDNIKKQIILFTLVALFGGLSAIVPTLIINGYQQIYRFGIFLAIPLILMYNGQRGRKSNFFKYGFYVFFPLHHLVLYIIYLILR